MSRLSMTDTLEHLQKAKGEAIDAEVIDLSPSGNGKSTQGNHIREGAKSTPTTLISKEDLLSMTFPDVAFVVEGLIPMGVSILAGKPKSGKSWMTLSVGDAIANGGEALGHFKTTSSPVLVLALEDHPRRLQSRLKIIGADQTGGDVQFVTAWRQGKPGLADLAQFLSDQSQVRTVFIDTLQRFRGAQKGDAVYAEDYQFTAELKSLADRFAVAIVCVHHLRKGVVSPDDPFESISGSNGIGGGVDNLLVLVRKNANKGELFIRGRDLPETSYGLHFEDGVWSWMGDLDSLAQAETQQTVGLILKHSPSPLTPKQVYTALQNEGDSQLTAAAIRGALSRMHKRGLVSRTEDYRYSYREGSEL